MQDIINKCSNTSINEYGDYCLDNFEQCVADYRLALFYDLDIVIKASRVLDITSERKRHLINVILERITAIVEDHNLAGLLTDIAS